VIRVRGLSKRYPGGTVALDGVDLDIAAGELVALIGPSGAGKSTLLRCLNGFVTPTAGEVQIGGATVSGATGEGLRLIRAGIGFVFQQFNLLPRMTALSNVELPLLYTDMPARERRSKAQGKLAAVNLEGREGHRPSQLSGGQQQRVAIARALVNDPGLLLADEPTGNLDTRTSVEIMAVIQELHRRGLTIVLVTHEPDIAQYAQRTLTFRDGQLLSDAPVRDRLDARTVLESMTPRRQAA